MASCSAPTGAGDCGDNQLSESSPGVIIEVTSFGPCARGLTPLAEPGAGIPGPNAKPGAANPPVARANPRCPTLSQPELASGSDATTLLPGANSSLRTQWCNDTRADAQPTFTQASCRRTF